ncbi:HNH endonuclease [Salmonella enterica]|nr:HNH endonuclease [Salmonella enterica]
MVWFCLVLAFVVIMIVITTKLEARKQALISSIERRQKEIAEARALTTSLYEQINRKPATNTAQTFYNSSEWRRLRYQALKLYGAKCACCGRSAKHGRVMHVDHIKPRSKYPELALEITNLQILCDECNVSKSNTDDIQWR